MIAKDIVNQVENADDHLESAKVEVSNLKEKIKQIKSNIDQQ